MHTLLADQIRRTLGLDEAPSAAVLDELKQLAGKASLSPAAARLLAGLGGFLGQVDAAYAQNERDLALSSGELAHGHARLHELQRVLHDLTNQQVAVDQHAIVSMTDVHGTITYANDKFCEVSGYSRDELLGKNHRIVRSAVHSAPVFEAMWAAISSGQVWHGEICNRSKKGPLYWVSASIVPFCDEAGLPVQYIAIRTDITERKRMEALVAESERRYRTVVDSLNEVVFRADADGRWSFLNPAWQEITGFGIGTTLGTPCLRSVHRDDRERALVFFTALASGACEICREEFRLMTFSGGGCWVELLARAERDADGRFTGTTGTLKDVSDRRKALEQLHEQLHFVQELIEVVPLPIYMKDTAGRYLQFNKAFEDFFGIQRDAWLGKTVHDLLPAADTVLHAEKDRLLLASPGQQNYEARVHTRSGEVRDTIYRKATLTKPDGSIAGLVGTIADITERKAQEAAIKAAEARLRHITNTVPGAVFQWEVGNGKIRYTFLSDRVMEIRGLDREALFADAGIATQQIVEEDRERIRQAVFLAAGRRQAWRDEYRIRMPNGTMRWIRGEISPQLELAANGATVFTGIWQDVTQLKEADARLREVTDNIPVAVYQYLLPGEGRHAFRFFSRGLEQISGLTAEAAVADADQLFALIHPDDRARVMASLRASAVSKSRWSIDFRLLHQRSGEIIWIHSESQPKAMPDGGTLWNGYIADVSEARRASDELRRAKEGAEAANRAKSDFLANMSHEIRTPMNGVIGMTDLALDTELSGKQREYLQIVKSSSEALMTIINDILDFSKIEAGKLLIERIPFDLWHMVGDTLKILALRANDKGLELICDIAPEMPRFVLGDPGRLRQILVNLLGNAIKFTEQGKVVLHVASDKNGSMRRDDNISLQFSIIDSGIGIPAHKLDTIFDAFSQEDSSITRKYGGTGLGLTISSRLAEALGGRIWVESEPGRGSVFHFTALFGLDRPQRAPADPAAQGGVPQALRDPHQLLDILLVEDHPINQKLAINLLERWGHRVTLAENGLLATEALRSHRFDIVLMDMMMPVMDGLEATRSIRAAEQGNAAPHTPIIAMTANAMQGDREACLAAGMDDYLAKPIQRLELEALLRQYAMRDASLASVAPETTVSPKRETAKAAPDFDYAAAVRAADPEIVGIIAGIFLEHYRNDLDKIRDGLAANDLQAVRFVAHALQGTLAMFGAQPAALLARRIEQQAARNEAPGLDALYAALAGELAHFSLALQPFADAAADAHDCEP